MKLYHIVPKDMRGTILYPLNRLREIFPDLYELKRAKYIGREEVAATYVPVLDCYWGDVVQMVAVPTEVIQRRQKLRGKELYRFFEIESDDLERSNLCAWLDDFVLFDPTLPVDRVSPEGKAFFEEKLRKDGWARPFVMIPHIFYKGEIDISGCPIVQ